MAQRRWGATLTSLVGPEDFTQQAWVYFLEGLPPAPEGVPQAVWEIGQLAARLSSWCRSMAWRKSHEVPIPDDFDFAGEDGDNQAAFSQVVLDHLEELQSRATPAEFAAVIFRYFGYDQSDAQEILGVSPSAYQQSLHRLRRRLSRGK